MDDAVVSYLSAFLWSSVFVEERHTKVGFGIETFDMREFIYISRGESLPGCLTNILTQSRASFLTLYLCT